jgi:hypothetical protein
MSKAAYYFSHDLNARNDEKIVSVRLKYGMQGYGVYFAILERLGESSQYIHVKDYNIISFDLRVDNSLVKSVIEDFGLFEFTDDGKHFYSVSFNDRMKPLDGMREQRRVAGKKSAEKRKSSPDFNDRSTTVEKNVNDRCPKIQQRKEKEIKGKEIKEENLKKENFDSGAEVFEISDLKKYSGEGWLEDIGMKKSIPPDELQSLFEKFCLDIELANYGEDVYLKTVSEFRRHFINWLNKHPKEKSSGKKESPAAGKKSKIEGLKEIAQRSLDDNS